MKTDQEQLLPVIERMILVEPQEAPVYRALKKMLDLGALTFTLSEHQGRLMKQWTTKRGYRLEHLADDIENDPQAALIRLFAEGRLAFVTEVNETPEIRFVASQDGLTTCKNTVDARRPHENDALGAR